MDVLLILNAVSTWVMVGIIWFVQVVHYPLFSGVGGDGFANYSARHSRRTTWVVAGPMMVELFTALALCWRTPDGVPAWMVWLGLALAIAILIATSLLSVPRHTVLAQGFDDDTWRALVRSNWIRTSLWSARGVLVAGMLWRAG